MNKKCITVPRTKEAEKKLNFDKALANELIEYYFLCDDDFYKIYRTNIFEEINESCGSMIGDFESAEITEKDNILKCIEILISKKKYSSSENIEIIEVLISLCNEAIERNTGVYFFF